MNGGDGRDWFLLNMNSAEQSRIDKIVTVHDISRMAV